MDEPLAVALKFGFLAVLYLFLLWVSRSALRDMSRFEDVAVGPEEADPAGTRPEPAASPDLRAGVNPRLVVVAAMGYEPGVSFDIGAGATMGRSDSAEIRVDDPYASSAHARIFARSEFMYIEDMGSTNGTYLNNRGLKTAERLKIGDVVRIGDSEYRYEE